ncbi:hypothetical protein B9G55_16855 [Saccharibacillus sp. O16]|nr:hypothetical protein B9G55_16855 [Saccharibacillus sp. O16]
MKRTTEGFGQKRRVQQVFMVTLTTLVIGGTLPLIGGGVAQAKSTEEVVQIVAGTGKPGNLKAPQAAWSDLQAPSDIHVFERHQNSSGGTPADASQSPHLLLFNDRINNETWLAAGNGISFPGSFVAPSDYLTLHFITADNKPVQVIKFADSPSFNFNALYFIGLAEGSSVPNIFRISSIEPPTPDPSGQGKTYLAEAVLDSNPLTSASGVAVGDSGIIYTFDDVAEKGYRIVPTSDGKLPYAIEEVPEMSFTTYGEPTVKDLAIRDGYMYMLNNTSFSGVTVTKINLRDSSADLRTFYLQQQDNEPQQPLSLSIDQNQYVYVADTGNHRIVKFDSQIPTDLPDLIPVAGTKVQDAGAPGTSAESTALNSPEDMAVADDGTLYISDTGNHRVLETAALQAPVTAVTGRAGDASVALSWQPADQALNYQIYKYAGTSAPADPRAWEYVGSTELTGTAPPTEWTAAGLTNGQPYVFAVRAKNWRSTSEFAVSEAVTPVGTTPTNPTNPTNPTPAEPAAPSDTPAPPPVSTTPTPQPTTTTIKVDVQNSAAANGSVVASLDITRTKGTDGTLKDQLQLTPTKAAEILGLLKASGSSTAAIVLPDAKDEVTQWDLTVPAEASKLLIDQGVGLVILNPNVQVTVPASSLTGLTNDVYFRLVPVKSAATSTELRQRALSNPEIVAQANGGDIQVLGRPMTIETNLQSRPVTLTLPLPSNTILTADQQKKIGVYIEHSDGTKQLVRGKVVAAENGKQGLEISISKFSTFTVVSVSNWDSTLNNAPYVKGYPDRTFKPEQDITRSELAAIVGRITGVTAGSATFSDVPGGSWASTVVGPAAASGVMTGYGDGTFKPNAAVTRGELAEVLAKLLPQSGLEPRPAAAGFRDLNGHWASDAIAQLQAQDIVEGYADGSFRPDALVSRAEAVTMINRLLGREASMALPGAGNWSDVAPGYWAQGAIRAASMEQ